MSQLSDEIKKLIDIVDKNYKDKIWSKIILRNLLYFLSLIAMTLVLYYGLLVGLQPFIEKNETIVTIIIAIYVLIIPIAVSFSREFLKVGTIEEINWNYENLQKNDDYKKVMNDTNKPILYALIVMKSKHPKLLLNNVAENREEFFDKGTLMDRLYKNPEKE